MKQDGWIINGNLQFKIVRTKSEKESESRYSTHSHELNNLLMSFLAN